VVVEVEAEEVVEEVEVEEVEILIQNHRVDEINFFNKN
jgi:hypothetical protein